MDEKSVGKGHKYLTLVPDLDAGTVEYLADDRQQGSLDGYYQGLSEEQRQGIEAVAMDIWDLYIASTKSYVPKAEEKIVFDRYHLMTHMGKALDTVRTASALQQVEQALVKSKYLGLYSEENLPEKHWERFEGLKGQPLEDCSGMGDQREPPGSLALFSERIRLAHFKRWYFWATHSRLEPVIKAARTFHRHLQNVLTYFKHRVSNAVCEGDSKIQTIIKMAYGFRNRDHLKTAIYFHCGGLDLYGFTKNPED